MQITYFVTAGYVMIQSWPWSDRIARKRQKSRIPRELPWNEYLQIRFLKTIAITPSFFLMSFFMYFMSFLFFFFNLYVFTRPLWCIYLLSITCLQERDPFFYTFPWSPETVRDVAVFTISLGFYTKLFLWNIYEIHICTAVVDESLHFKLFLCQLL